MSVPRRKLISQIGILMYSIIPKTFILFIWINFNNCNAGILPVRVFYFHFFARRNFYSPKFFLNSHFSSNSVEKFSFFTSFGRFFYIVPMVKQFKVICIIISLYWFITKKFVQHSISKTKFRIITIVLPNISRNKFQIRIMHSLFKVSFHIFFILFSIALFALFIAIITYCMFDTTEKRSSIGSYIIRITYQTIRYFYSNFFSRQFVFSYTIIILLN